MILYQSGQQLSEGGSDQSSETIANAEINLKNYIAIISGDIAETTNKLILIISDGARTIID